MADGSILIITEIDSDGVSKGTKKIKGTLEDLGKTSESTGEKIGGGISNGFKKLGAALASAAIIDKIVDFAVENKIDFAVVAPDDPLVLGAVDALEAKGIPCFGPSKNAAIIEGSKVFSKNLMKKYNIPTAAYENFDDADKAIVALDKIGANIISSDALFA